MRKLIFFAAAALALASCTKEASVEVNPGASHAVGFSTYSARSLTKAGSTLVDDAADADGENTTHLFGGFQTIGVFAWNTGEGGNFGETPNFMGVGSAGQKVELAKGGADASSNYTPVKYWPTDGDELTFSAYYPYMDNNSGIVVSNGSSYKFTVKDNVGDQVDFMLADVKSGMTYANSGDGSVEFTFHHMLTRVLFEVKADPTSCDVDKYVGAPTDGSDDRRSEAQKLIDAFLESVSSISVDEISFVTVNAGSVTVGTGAIGDWKFDATNTTKYKVASNLVWNNTRLNAGAESNLLTSGAYYADGTAYTDTDGKNTITPSYLMIPVDDNDNSDGAVKANVTYTITYKDGRETKNELVGDKAVDLTALTTDNGNTAKWDKNSFIKYTILVGHVAGTSGDGGDVTGLQPITFKAQVADWDKMKTVSYNAAQTSKPKDSNS